MSNRSRRLILGITVLAASVAPIAARAEIACSAEGTTLTISGDAGNDSILVGVDGVDILVGPSFSDVQTCGNTNTIDRIDILPAGGDDDVSLFDPATIAPGASGEDTGMPEIEVGVDGGAGTNSVDVYGDANPFTLVAGTLGANWNEDDDIDWTFANVQSFGFWEARLRTPSTCAGRCSPDRPSRSPPRSSADRWQISCSAAPGTTPSRAWLATTC